MYAMNLSSFLPVLSCLLYLIYNGKLVHALDKAMRVSVYELVFAPRLNNLEAFSSSEKILNLTYMELSYITCIDIFHIVIIIEETQFM